MPEVSLHAVNIPRDAEEFQRASYLVFPAIAYLARREPSYRFAETLRDLRHRSKYPIAIVTLSARQIAEHLLRRIELAPLHPLPAAACDVPVA